MPESCPYVAKNKCNKVFFSTKKKCQKDNRTMKDNTLLSLLYREVADGWAGAY
jgi:hypothetical protein